MITNSYHKLGSDFYKDQNSVKVKNPQLVVFNQLLAKQLNIPLDKSEKYLADIFSGNKLLPKSKPISLAYAGHQFGHFVPQLGDGRALLLGEIAGKNNILHDIQLKGSGKTFFSRNGDGKCPVDAAIREYIFGEAMYYLKIPTTRSLALIVSDEFIQREIPKQSAVISRVAKSHIRIGTFEYFACRKDVKNLQKLSDYTINRHFPKYNEMENKYLYLLKSVIKLQAELVSSWMSIGFIHGVMNTDNTTISGETIDYGPCAFMDQYKSDQCFSYIDKIGRYSFSNQKNIILWNLVKFAESILLVIDQDINKAMQLAQIEINKFSNLFDKIYFQKMAKKIGFFDYKNSKKDIEIIKDFLDILEENNIDFTNGFRALSKILYNADIFNIKDIKYINWKKRWAKRLGDQRVSFENISKKLDKINPILIPRNHTIANIIKNVMEKNDYCEFKEFLQAIKHPFDENLKYQKYYLPPQENEKVINTFCGT